jgi:plasmid stability protein
MGRQADRHARFARSRRRGTATPARTLQYTVRNIPEDVDRALRRRAVESGKSLNEVLRDALIREAGVVESSTPRYTDLDSLAGTWIDDAGFDETIRAQDQVDESLWR